MEKAEIQHPIYSNSVIEFVTVAAETCSFIERIEEIEKKSFVDKLTKLFPLLYLKASLLPKLNQESEEELASYVTEEDYEDLKNIISLKLGDSDDYLEVFTEDMQYSETPILASISENIMDIYQDLKDMIGNFQTANLPLMNDSILNCKDNFENYWGQKLLNSLRALHNVLYNVDLESDEDL